jgi:hypothetical protein
MPSDQVVAGDIVVGCHGSAHVGVGLGKAWQPVGMQ